MDTLLQQLKKRRLELGLKQNDMMLRVGVSRQQYQRLESKGNPRLATLELIAKGLNSEIALIPKEKLGAVLAVLEDSTTEEREAGSKGADSDNTMHGQRGQTESLSQKSLSDDPWQDLLGDDS
jgi:transcriptional regulator with XRE-family HTH domain